MPNKKEYLGDGVYAQVSEGMILLTTEDGIEITNEIYLESSVIESFLKYVQRLE